MGRHPDVLVVGGGVIGLTSAYLLAKSGLRVEVVDKGEMGREASWAGAGILPPWGDGEYATPLDRLRAYSVSRFAALSADLRERTGIDNEYHVCGGVEFLTEADADIPDLWQREGVRFEPTTCDGFRLPFAQVRNPRHLSALIQACLHVGIKLSPHALVDWLDDSSSGCLAIPPDHSYRPPPSRWLLVSAGAWTDHLLGEPDRLPLVRPVRGQMVLLNPGRRVAQHIMIRGKRYLVPRLDGRVLVGSTEEPEAGFVKATTPEAITGLIDFAEALVPELRGAPVEATWSGLRPGSADGLPYIGPAPGRPNVLVAAGHFRAGIQTSIGTAECVRALVLGEPPPVPLEAFAPGRTPHPPMRTAFRS